MDLQELGEPVAIDTIGTEVRRRLKSGRHYQILPEPAPPYVSVTTFLNVINKPAIGPWMAKREREMVLKCAAKYYFGGVEGEVPSSLEAYMAILNSLVGRERAATKEMEKAGDIGTEAHNFIEWYLRDNYFAGTAGKEPDELCDPAMIAVNHFFDWEKLVDLDPIGIEQVVFSHDWKIAGTLDLVAWVTLKDLGRVKALVDFKTGKAVYAEAYIQTCLYENCRREMGLQPTDVRIILRLPKTEKDPIFEPVVVEGYMEHIKAGKEALGLWQWQQKNSKYK